MEADKKEQGNVIEKFKQEIKDKDVENVIAGKKGDHLVGFLSTCDDNNVDYHRYSGLAICVEKYAAFSQRFCWFFKVKDLKRQLKLERKKTEQLQQRLQEACSENRARESKHSEIKGPR